MTYLVGPKGQIVIAKEIRDRLGVGPGWHALERLVDDHVEVYFLPPEHEKSLKGSLAPYTKTRIVSGEDWTRAREDTWSGMARDKAGPQ